MDNKAIMRRWAKDLNEHNLSGLDDLIHPDFVDHNPMPGSNPDKAGYIATLNQAHEEWFPDMHVEVLDVVAEGDKVAARVNVTATHQGDALGAKATGNPIAWEAFGFYRLKDGKLIERWELLDTAAFMTQLGLLKPAG